MTDHEPVTKRVRITKFATISRTVAQEIATNNGTTEKMVCEKSSVAPRYGSRLSKMTQLGSGTFGEVWKGFDKDLDRWVAIKRFQEVKSDHLGINMMIIREISLLKHLDHPNIAKTLDVLVGRKMNNESLLLIMVRSQFLLTEISSHTVLLLIVKQLLIVKLSGT